MNLSLLYDSNDDYLDPEIILAKKPMEMEDLGQEEEIVEP